MTAEMHDLVTRQRAAVTPPIAALDVPLTDVERDIAAKNFTRRMERLDWLKAHPEAATVPNPASAGERAEWTHFLYDADPDFELPPLTQETNR